MVAHPSLSIVLPVHNAEQTLAVRIVQLLDIVPDLTTNFEVLVINDGSTDHTEEVAYELAREYPQIHVTRHELRRGNRGAVETGLAETSGDILFIQDEQAPIDSSKLNRLWELRNEEVQIFAQPKLRVQRAVTQQLAAWGVRLEDITPNGGPSGVQMIRRQDSAQGEKLAAFEPGLQSRKSRTDRPEVHRGKQPTTKFTTLDRQRSFSRKP